MDTLRPDGRPREPLRALRTRLAEAGRTMRAAVGPSGHRSVLPRWALIVALALVIAIAAIWFFSRPPLVRVAQATRGEAVNVVYATGVVDYVRAARIAPVATAPIVRVFVEEGAFVTAGALLAQLEDGPARATALQLAAQASTARLAAARTQRLFRAGFASRAALDEALGQRNAANAAAASAQARLSDYALRAPFSGAVLRRDAEPGDLAAPSTVLFVIADETGLRVTADLDERDIARVQVGQEALVRADAFPSQTFAARVSSITPEGDASTRVFRVRLTVRGQTPLRAGMTVEANVIAARRQNAVLAPASAVREDSVWVVRDGRVARRLVELGATGAARVEIIDGLDAGEIVVASPDIELRDGQRVRIAEGAVP